MTLRTLTMRLDEAGSREAPAAAIIVTAILTALSAVGATAPAALAQAPAEDRRIPDPAFGASPPPNARIHQLEEGEIRVTAAVPSADEAGELFSSKLYRRNVQPVWIKVENRGQEPLWFLPLGLDENYFLPTEAARRALRHEPRAPTEYLDFLSRSISSYIPPGTARSGYVYSRVDEGTKSFNVDLVEAGGQYRLSFFIPVPGLRVDHYEVDLLELHPQDALVEVNRAELVAALEALPCCVKDKKGRKDGDPLNIALVGDPQDLYYAFMRAGWDETEIVYGASLLRMLRSALSGSEYRYSPVSALYVFDRAQDVALQKARNNINQRNHLRLWLTPLRYEGRPVWIGQISRDIGVRFTTKTITTHKIDPAVDDGREYLIEDLAYAQSLAGFGYVPGVGAASIDEPRGNLTGDPYFTDGLRAVLFIAEQPTSIAEIEIMDLGASP